MAAARASEARWHKGEPQGLGILFSFGDFGGGLAEHTQHF